MPTSNLVFMFDGEEEAGSRNLRTYMEMASETLDDIDIWLFFDGPAHPSGRPQITFGVRGSVGMEVTVYGATRNLHSGHYGNWAPDTGNILAHLLASMKDQDGNVLVEGWYDHRPSRLVRKSGQRFRPCPTGMTSSAGSLASRRRRVSHNHSRSVSSFRRSTSAASRVAIPARSPATSFPTRPSPPFGNPDGEGQTRRNILRQCIIDHIVRQGFHVVEEDPDMETRLRYPRIAKVTGGRGGSIAARTSMSDPFAQSVMEAASAAADRAFSEGALVLAPGMGGTLPLYLFTEVAGKPAIVVPVANHDNNQHAPDENLRIANLWYAIDLYAALMTMP